MLVCVESEQGLTNCVSGYFPQLYFPLTSSVLWGVKAVGRGQVCGLWGAETVSVTFDKNFIHV